MFGFGDGDGDGDADGDGSIEMLSELKQRFGYGVVAHKYLRKERSTSTPTEASEEWTQVVEKKSRHRRENSL